MRTLVRRALALSLAACLFAAHPAQAAVRANARIVTSAAGPVSGAGFQKALSSQLSGFLKLAPDAGLSRLTAVSHGAGAAEDKAAATTLLALLATPEVSALEPSAREQLALRIGVENLGTIEVLADRLGRDHRLAGFLSQVRAWFDSSEDGSASGVAAIGLALDQLFDGSAKDAPVVVDGTGKAGTAPGPARLKKPSRTPARIFAAAKPDSSAIEAIQAEGRDFDEVAAEAIRVDTFYRERRFVFQSMVEEDQPRDVKAYVAALKEILAFAETADRDEQALDFVTSAARRHAADYLASRPVEKGSPYRLPPNPLGTGEYWDLASGIHAGNFILWGLEAATRYRFFDVSPFVIEYLNEIQRLAVEKGVPGAGNVEIVAQDVRTIERPSVPLSGIRAKNVHTYVPGFEKDLETMAGWIAEGGQLVIENDPGWQRHGIIEKLGPMIQRLIEDGWSFEFRLYRDPLPTHNPYLETLVLTRPKAGQSLISRSSWKDYVRRAVSGLL